MGNRDLRRRGVVFNEEMQILKRTTFDRQIITNDDTQQIINATSWKNSLEKRIQRLKNDFNRYFYRGLDIKMNRIDKKY